MSAAEQGPDLAAAVESILDRMDFGRPSARKAGRNPAYPYVPVLRYRSGRSEQILCLAFETREEAIACARAKVERSRDTSWCLWPPSEKRPSWAADWSTAIDSVYVEEASAVDALNRLADAVPVSAREETLEAIAALRAAILSTPASSKEPSS